MQNLPHTRRGAAQLLGRGPLELLSAQITALGMGHVPPTSTDSVFHCVTGSRSSHWCSCTL